MSSSLFRSAFDRVTAAREKQARRYVNTYLLSLDDDTLKSLGHSRSELRKGPGAPLPF
ncbi:MAG: hypothetical protein NXI27_06285 [Alphaproteobacteria bacterium]|nr:hypothetical protein [Alphaproteobacteria bacterium]